MQTVTKIEYSPCTGFGAHGRTAALYSGAVCIGAGHGATDAEAVTEALVAAGMHYDDAADAAGPLITAHGGAVTGRDADWLALLASDVRDMRDAMI